MFIPPQIVSTPHIVTSSFAPVEGACSNNYNAGGVTCASDFTCTPYNGTCIDSTYWGSPISAVISVLKGI